MQHPGFEGGQARRKVDANIYRAVLTIIFGVGFFVVTLDFYSAAAQGGVLCACEVVTGKLCHGTAICEQLLLWYLLLILLASWVGSYFLREYLVFGYKGDFFLKLTIFQWTCVCVWICCMCRLCPSHFIYTVSICSSTSQQFVCWEVDEQIPEPLLGIFWH